LSSEFSTAKDRATPGSELALVLQIVGLSAISLLPIKCHDLPVCRKLILVLLNGYGQCRCDRATSAVEQRKDVVVFQTLERGSCLARHNQFRHEMFDEP
jgi:hypothetical protein